MNPNQPGAELDAETTVNGFRYIRTDLVDDMLIGAQIMALEALEHNPQMHGDWQAVVDSELTRLRSGEGLAVAPDRKTEDAFNTGFTEGYKEGRKDAATS